MIARCLNGTEGAWEEFVDCYLALITHVVTSTARSRLGEIPGEWRDDFGAEVTVQLVGNDFASFSRPKFLGDLFSCRHAADCGSLGSQTAAGCRGWGGQCGRSCDGRREPVG